MQKQFVSSIDAILDVKFSPDEKLLATAGMDHNIAISDLAAGIRLRRLFVLVHEMGDLKRELLRSCRP